MRDFYNSARWRRDSAAFLREHPLCKECERLGRVTAARVCDHIIPIRKGGDPWNWNNRQALCLKCHAKKSGRDAH